jgi:hypothetical protein
MRELASNSKLKSNVIRSLAIQWVAHAGQVLREMLDKERNPGLPDCVLGMRLTSPRK